MNQDALKNVIFVPIDQTISRGQSFIQAQEALKTEKYYVVKIKTILVKKEKRQVLQFVDISQAVLYDQQKD